MGEYATTTKPEEQSSRPNVRDLFPKKPKKSSEQQEINIDTISEQDATRL
jgi:hypothetical protein